MRTFALAFALSLTLGCNKEPAPETKGGPAGSSSAPVAAASTSASASAAPSAMAGKHHKGMRRGGFGGPSAMLFHEASELPSLDAAKKTKVEELQKQSFAEMPREELKSLHDELVSEVRAGKIDQAKIDAKRADVEKAMKAHHEKSAAALNQLHATLDEGQRKAVVAKVREDMKKREERMAKWKDKEKGPKAGGFAAHLTQELGLDEAQQKKLEAIMPKGEKAMPDFEAMKKRNDALLDAFEKDGFDAKKLEMPSEQKTAAHGPMDGKFLAQLLPILKPEQREKLANDMAKMGGPHGPMGAPGAAPSGSAAPPPGDDDDDDDKP